MSGRGTEKSGKQRKQQFFLRKKKTKKKMILNLKFWGGFFRYTNNTIKSV